MFVCIHNCFYKRKMRKFELLKDNTLGDLKCKVFKCFSLCYSWRSSLHLLFFFLLNIPICLHLHSVSLFLQLYVFSACISSLIFFTSLYIFTNLICFFVLYIFLEFLHTCFILLVCIFVGSVSHSYYHFFLGV